jgi:hypothetical protein
MDIDNITEEEALDVLHKLRTKFHWAGTVFMKDDIIYRWKDKYGEEEGQALSDEQIESVMTSWEWRKGLDEAMTSSGYEVLDMALWEVKTGEEQ